MVLPGQTRRRLVRLLFRSGALRAAHQLWPRRLTVLAYHRIADLDDPDFAGLPANVSATPVAFAAQLRLLRRWFNPIPLELLLAWLAGRAALPPYPALITFDDGYRDNLTQALPALRAQGLPAVLFLATGCVGNPDPFFWDLAAYCFKATRRTRADLPLLGPAAWPDAAARECLLAAWLAAAKQRPASEIGGLAAALRSALEVDVPPETFGRHHLTWAQVGELARSGVAIGAHTDGHVILARAPPEHAREEVLRSRQRIEAALGTPVTGFAYPNGLAGDHRGEDVAMLRREGFGAAFTLRDGPTGWAEVRREPLGIRRIQVTANDDLASFAASLVGLTRLIRSLKGTARARRAGAQPGWTQGRPRARA